ATAATAASMRMRPRTRRTPSTLRIPGLTAIRTANARCLGNHRMKIAEPAMRNVLGVRRVLGLILMLAAVAAVAYLERSVGGDFDLRLVYFLIVLSGAM